MSSDGPHGVLVIDKPAGKTSHDVVAIVRRLLRDAGLKGWKVGHAGTLDPDATGVLVVALGRATRLVTYVQAGRKTYDARIQLGVTTSTLDASGDVLTEADASGVDEPMLCEALKSFVGDIEQIPPMVSAVKVGGERLYLKARRGEEIERKPRPVTISDIVLEDFTPGRRAEAAFLVTCSAGTYIRTLAADVGEKLGVGAHLVTLRRLASGRFGVQQAVSLDRLADLGADGLGEVLLSPAAALADFPARTATEAEVVDIAHGRFLAPTGVPGPVALLSGDGTLLAMVEDQGERARPQVVLAPAGQEGAA